MKINLYLWFDPRKFLCYVIAVNLSKQKMKNNKSKQNFVGKIFGGYDLAGKLYVFMFVRKEISWDYDVVLFSRYKRRANLQLL